MLCFLALGFTFSFYCVVLVVGRTLLVERGRGDCILFLVRLSLGFILGFLVAVSALCGAACGVFGFWVGLNLMLGFFVVGLCVLGLCVCVLWV